MYRLATRFASDLDTWVARRKGTRQAIRLSDLPLPDFYKVVRSLPYKRDNAPIEVIARPSHVLKHGPLLGADCKKRAILLGAYLERNGIAWRFVTSSARPDKRHHHIYVQAAAVPLAGGRPGWLNVDATYPHYRLGQRKRVTSWAIMPRPKGAR